MASKCLNYYHNTYCKLVAYYLVKNYLLDITQIPLLLVIKNSIWHYLMI